MVTNDEVLEALRKLWVKLEAVEKKIDALSGKSDQARLELPGTKQRKGNPEFILLRTRLMAVWMAAKASKYNFEARDAKGLASLLRRCGKTPEAIERIAGQWERAVKDGCVSIFSFDMNFNRWNPVTSGTNRPKVEGAVDLYKEQPK